MEIISSVFALLIAVGFIWIIFWFYISLPSEMAQSRNRSALAWVLVSIFMSPILAIFLLWLLGPIEVTEQ